MNLLTKKTCWTVVALLTATMVFGDEKCHFQKTEEACRPKKSFEQSQRFEQEQMMPAYNSPARIDVRGSWDIFVKGSFLYWQLAQDNMAVAFADSLSNASYVNDSQINGHLVPMEFGYKPGFKAGMGLNSNHDHWDCYIEYTRLHAKNSTSTNGLLDSTGSAAPIFPTWGHPWIQRGNAYDNASENWLCHLDILDIDLGRVYYVGTHLTFRPEFGARGAWIRQDVAAGYNNSSFSSGLESRGSANVHQKSHSWAIGPKAGIDTNWMLGCGFRIYGNTFADILYTDYKLHNKTIFVPASGTTKSFISKAKIPALRTHLDIELGLGWGSYFDNNNWHIDLSASYGFQVFFDQNMLSCVQDSSSPGYVIQPTGNLYAQGLTANLRLDF